MLTVATLNVNGIRAAFRRGMGRWLAARSPDVLALQEVRATDGHLLALLGDGWHVVHEACEVPGRAGVAPAAGSPPGPDGDGTSATASCASGGTPSSGDC